MTDIKPGKRAMWKEMIKLLTRIETDIKHIKIQVDKNEEHLGGINGRVRQNEKNISYIKGIGSVVMVAYTTIIGFFLKR